jgi:K+-sensing histidine kinase KdpD
VKPKSRSIIILTVLFGYIFLQFIWWEILLVRQTGQIIDLKQKIAELNISGEPERVREIDLLHHKKKMQVVMIVGEGTVFLLLLLFGVFKIRQAQNREMELTNQQKNFFLSITHELKTPIAATKLQLQTLQKHQLGAGQQAELIGNALNETERLNALIDNLLLANRLDSGEYIFKKEKENISALTGDILERYYKNELRNNEVSMRIEENLFLETDRTAFPSIVTNLVDNALKYSFQKKNVEVRLRRENAGILLSVSDQGAGIPEEDRKKIFTRFYRSGSEETRRTKGTGLGLYIVNYLVKKHGASVEVKNNSPAGSVFEIRFHAA